MKGRIKQTFDEYQFHDYVVSHGLGPPIPKGYEIGKWLIETGDDYATAAHEVVARGLTVIEEKEEEKGEIKMSKDLIWKDEKGIVKFNISVEKNGIKASWVNLGEGYSGDYNPSDTEDENLLRFDLSVWDNDIKDYREVSDGSYCTQVTADTNKQKLENMLYYIIDYVKEDIHTYGHAKRKCEELSHIDSSWQSNTPQTEEKMSNNQNYDYDPAEIRLKKKMKEDFIFRKETLFDPKVDTLEACENVLDAVRGEYPEYDDDNDVNLETFSKAAKAAHAENVYEFIFDVKETLVSKINLVLSSNENLVLEYNHTEKKWTGGEYLYSAAMRSGSIPVSANDAEKYAGNLGIPEPDLDNENRMRMS